MNESNAIANLEAVFSKEEDPLRMRLMIFNHVSRNGRIYVAESKEHIQKLIDKKLYLTSGFESNVDLISKDSTFVEQQKAATIDISKLIGQFQDIEIVETGDIGVDDLPIFEVYGKLKFFETLSTEFHKNCFDANIVTIGLRSFGYVNQDKKVNLNQVVCWDTIVR